MLVDELEQKAIEVGEWLMRLLWPLPKETPPYETHEQIAENLEEANHE